MDGLNSYDVRLWQSEKNGLTAYRSRLAEASDKRVLKDPKNYIDDRRLALDRSQMGLLAVQERIIAQDRRTFASLAASLDAMSPLKVLGRGYSIVSDSRGNILKSAAEAASGDRITVRFKNDSLRCVVEEKVEDSGKE